MASQVWTLSEQQRLAKASNVEATMKGTRQNTAFVGNIPDGMNDETMERLLCACGPVKQWRRVLDAGNLPKSFGFCEFDSADALSRALNLLNDLLLVASGGKRLLVRVDDATRRYLDEYEQALGLDDVANSSREADVKALEEIRNVVKEKGFHPAMEALDKKLFLLNAEEPEEGEAIEDELEEQIVGRDESTREGEEASRSESRRPRKNRSKGREVTTASTTTTSMEYIRQQRREAEQRYRQFKEREARWENREVQWVARRKKEELAEADRLRRETDDREYARKYLASFDDFNWLISCLDKFLGIERPQSHELMMNNGNERIPEFYSNRELWKTRRMRERERENEADRRDEQQEEREIVKQKSATIEQSQNEMVGKRHRPKAAELIDESSAVISKEKRTRGPLISRDYSKEELLAAGMSEEEALNKLKELYREKASKLLAIIPQSRDELFAWPIEWKFLDLTKMQALIRKKVTEVLQRYRHTSRHIDRLTDSLLSQIQQRVSPTSIVEFVYEDGRLVDDRTSGEKQREEAANFVAILWRYLIFETESTAYGISPPTVQ